MIGLIVVYFMHIDATRMVDDGKSTLLQDNTVCSGVDGHSNRTEASEPTIGVVMTAGDGCGAISGGGGGLGDRRSEGVLRVQITCHLQVDDHSSTHRPNPSIATPRCCCPACWLPLEPLEEVWGLVVAEICRNPSCAS